jgi:hypothetical protein
MACRPRITLGISHKRSKILATQKPTFVRDDLMIIYKIIEILKMTRMSKQKTRGYDIHIKRSFYAIYENVYHTFFNAYIVSVIKSRLLEQSLNAFTLGLLQEVTGQSK